MTIQILIFYCFVDGIPLPPCRNHESPLILTFLLEYHCNLDLHNQVISIEGTRIRTHFDDLLQFIRNHHSLSSHVEYLRRYQKLRLGVSSSLNLLLLQLFSPNLLNFGPLLITEYHFRLFHPWCFFVHALSLDVLNNLYTICFQNLFVLEFFAAGHIVGFSFANCLWWAVVLKMKWIAVEF